MRLTPKQTVASNYLANHKTNEVLFGGGAGGGKSAFGCLFLLDRCSQLPGSRWLMGRSKLKALKETTLATFFDVCSKLEIPQDHYKYNAQDSTITFPKWGNSKIILKDLFLYPSDPNFDSLGSLEITGAFIDECNQVSEKAWEVTRSRIRYRLDEYGVIPKILGTCNPAKNWVYKRFYKPDRDGKLDKDKAFIQSLATDNPYISPHYIESLKKLKDKATKERLLLGNWEYDDDPAKIMEYDAIVDMFSNTFVPDGKSYITADIARFGSDHTVILVWDGWRIIHRRAEPQTKVTETFEIIETLRQQYSVPKSRVICDEDGVGGGVVDLGGYVGFTNIASPIKIDGEVEQYRYLMDQCSFFAAEKVNKREIWYKADVSTDTQNNIIEETESIKRDKPNQDGKLRIIPKDQIKDIIGRSPDDWDAIKMRAYPELEKPVDWNVLAELYE